MIGCDGLKGGMEGGGGVWDQNQTLFQIPSNNHEEQMTLESCEC